MTILNRLRSAESDRQQEAEAKALKEGCELPVHRVEDVWGGYWQCKSPSGVYTFRLPPLEAKDTP